MKSKQWLLKLPDPRHGGDETSQQDLCSGPVSLAIIDSAAQMVEAQMCNNSIKLTSQCFHKVRYTQRTPAGNSHFTLYP